MILEMKDEQLIHMLTELQKRVIGFFLPHYAPINHIELIVEIDEERNMIKTIFIGNLLGLSITHTTTIAGKTLLIEGNTESTNLHDLSQNPYKLMEFHNKWLKLIGVKE